MLAEVDQNVMDKQCAKVKRKNLLTENENLIAKCLSNQLLHDMEQSRCLDLEAEISKSKHETQKDVHDKMIKHVSKLEGEYLNLQLKYQHLQEHFDNKKSQTSQALLEFDSFFKFQLSFFLDSLLFQVSQLSVEGDHHEVKVNEKRKMHNFTPELRMTPIKEISTNRGSEGEDES
ncbi:hypothetical protein Tco_0271640 [Tanacetum coccineum]